MALPKKRSLEPLFWILSIVLTAGAVCYHVWQRQHPRVIVISSPGAKARTNLAPPGKESSNAVPSRSSMTPDRTAIPAMKPEPAKPEPEEMEREARRPDAAKAAPAKAPTVFDQPLILDALAGKKAENLKRAEAGFQQALEAGKWNEYLAWQRAALAAELGKNWGFDQPNSYDRFLANPLFYAALLQSTLIARLPEDARRAVTGDMAGRAFYQWLFKTPEAMESLLTNMQAGDSPKNVLGVWASLAVRDPEAQASYRELALAIALVWDQPFIREWNRERLDIPASQRYDYYKQHDLAGDLATRIHRMPASDLVWVVCAPVPISELQWALKKIKLRRKDWGQAYGMVKYDMDKAVSGQSKEPYDSYTFAEILKKGGVCGDRTYFSANTARALGIPACYLGGDGARGPHAWLAWMSDDEHWSTDGRLAGYGSGTTEDPQTGKPVAEQELMRRSDPRESSPAIQTKAHRFLWLAKLHETLGETPKADAALGFALKTSPRMPVAWEAKLAHWRKHHGQDPVAAWNEVVDELKHRFPQDKGMLAEARKIEEELIFPRQDVQASLRELKQDARRLTDPRKAIGPGDVTLLAQTVKREADLLAARKERDALHQLYRRALQEHGDDTAAFRALAGDYFALAKVNAEETRKAARQIDAAYDRYVETKSNDYFDIVGQNSVGELIARCWREAGEPEKAERIEKQLGKRLQKGKRMAL